MERSKVVTALAEIASQGKYEVSPEGARRMNQVFTLVANLINELEAEESVPVSETGGGENVDAE